MYSSESIFLDGSCKSVFLKSILLDYEAGETIVTTEAMKE